MNKAMKDLIRILSQKEERDEMLRMVLEEEMKGKVKEVLEEIALLEREAFCEEQEDRKNGFYERDLETPLGTIADLSIPRTRRKGFHPFFLEPYKRTLYTLDELVIAMYQGGCSTRDIARTLGMLLKGKYSPGWISRITNLVAERVREWRERPIGEWYPILFLDGVVLKVRRDTVSNEVVYLALGIDEEGHQEVLGFWVFGSDGESACSWREILFTLKKRGLTEPLLVVGDGLTGLPEAVKEVYPNADFQSCFLHKIRSALRKVRKRDEQGILEDLKRMYTASSPEEFKAYFETFEKNWQRLYPEVVASWERDLPYLTTYLEYPTILQRYIRTTNSIERCIKEVKRRSKVIEVFPDPQAIGKLLYLVCIERNEQYAERALPNFFLVKEELLTMRRTRYEKGGEKVACVLTQNS